MSYGAYGAWLLPDGEIIPAPDGHLILMHEWNKTREEDDYITYEKLYNDGWVRVIHQPALYIQGSNTSQLTDIQKSILKSFLKQLLTGNYSTARRFGRSVGYADFKDAKGNFNNVRDLDRLLEGTIALQN